MKRKDTSNEEQMAIDDDDRKLVSSVDIEDKKPAAIRGKVSNAKNNKVDRAANECATSTESKKPRDDILDYNKYGELLDFDKYGPVPYLCQIKDERGVLGTGRCGIVKEIRWRGRRVAMKEFTSERDNDERFFYDVFEREREVYLNLKELWGTHVPAMLFHNPWYSCPTLGIQLGEPIIEWDIEKWGDEDKLKLQETINALKKLGWEQRHMSGQNFVRIWKGDTSYIAVVDMEDVYRIGEDYGAWN